MSCAVLKNLDTPLWLDCHISFDILNKGEVEPYPFSKPLRNSDPLPLARKKYPSEYPY
jgi:hypothetical protein